MVEAVNVLPHQAPEPKEVREEAPLVPQGRHGAVQPRSLLLVLVAATFGNRARASARPAGQLRARLLVHAPALQVGAVVDVEARLGEGADAVPRRARVEGADLRKGGVRGRDKTVAGSEIPGAVALSLARPVWTS